MGDSSHVVALYPLLKFVIAVLIAIPLCLLASLLIRKLPLAKWSTVSCGS